MTAADGAPHPPAAAGIGGAGWSGGGGAGFAPHRDGLFSAGLADTAVGGGGARLEEAALATERLVVDAAPFGFLLKALRSLSRFV